MVQVEQGVLLEPQEIQVNLGMLVMSAQEVLAVQEVLKEITETLVYLEIQEQMELVVLEVQVD